ncbi:MAG: prepilin-type N-terminal cleavage/methylation domain-containing protein [candidate division Zixibacteria bacterium]|nr:prepilin-type N-terminal cleavage/methylation domain-containing protein [candidate division Zixibacteria bacterium]
MSTICRKEQGFSLIELTVIMVVIGIMLAVAMKSMTTVTEDIRRTKTLQEMESLAKGITGNPDITAGGLRSDFGYIGDIGAFPPGLQALVTNPGYSTWHGPYLPAGFVQDTDGYRLDEWGQPYVYDGGLYITSTGSGANLTKKLADNASDYLLNTYRARLHDAADNPPGVIYRDSVAVRITIPDGSGMTTTKNYPVDSAGLFTLDSLPVGKHPLRMIYTPRVDTLLRYITVLPRHKSQPLPVFQFAAAYFSGDTGTVYDSVLTKISGSDSIYSGFCNNISLWIQNNTGASVTINSLKLTWSGPTAYYRYVIWDGTTVFNRNNPKAASGETVFFSSGQTIAQGESLKIQIEDFRNQPNGGSRVNMHNTDFTLELSDGSTLTVIVGSCP